MKVNSLAKEVPSNSESVGSRDSPKAAQGPNTLDTNAALWDLCEQADKTAPSSAVCVGEKTKQHNCRQFARSRRTNQYTVVCSHSGRAAQ